MTPRLLRLAAASGAVFLSALTFAAGAGAATDISALAGRWDIAQPDQNRQCRVTLRAEAAGDGQALAMPAGCRKAMPMLAAAVGWRPAGERGVSVTDAGGQELLRFEPKTNGDFEARSARGEVYVLSPTDQAQRRQLAQAAVPGLQPLKAGQAPAQQAAKSGAPAPAAAAAAAPAAAKIAPPRPQEIPGRYILLREANRDTGCMVTLDDRARGVKGNKAVLAPACRDQGLVIFDPVGWSFQGGRILLYARKGHHATFDPYADGTWQKDPKEGGKPLGLRKI